MSANMFRWASAASLILLGATAAAAQASRPWVDPPAATGAPSTSSDPSSGSDEEVWMPPFTTGSIAPKRADRQAAAKPRAASEHVQPQVTAPKASARRPTDATRDRDRARVATPAKARKLATAAEKQTGPRLQASDRQIAARLSSSERRFKTVRDAVDAGYRIATIRTIEFPDGRRVQVMTRTDPGTELDLLDRPY